MKNLVSLANSLRRQVGTAKFMGQLVIRIVTSPRIWERVFVKKIRGSALSPVLSTLTTYESDELVSVVLPVNNGRSKGVERLVSSLKAQTHQFVELIAVDSGSTDDTVPWLRSAGFKVHEIDPAKFTHAYSRNIGASLANGTYVLFVVDDAVFNDPDWLRTALYMMNQFGVDSISTSQVIDQHADAYARLLDSYLAGAQNNRLGINLSRNNPVATLLRRILPLRCTFRSVAIDDTNHLVRKDVIQNLKFLTPTVEDIDFAIRLTISGGKTLYTNLLSVVHYHKYDLSRLGSYARRVYIDTRVIAQWQPEYVTIESRESFLVNACFALAILLEALEFEHLRTSGHSTKHESFKNQDVNISKGAASDFMTVLSERYRKQNRQLRMRKLKPMDEARAIFEDVFGHGPPSDIYLDTALLDFQFARLKVDIGRAIEALFITKFDFLPYNQFKTVCIFLWCNRLMTFLAREDVFRKKEAEYEFDGWGIANWS